MEIVKVFLSVALFALALEQPAFANTGPGPNLVLAEMLMFVLLVALTAAGGGYAMLKNSGEHWAIGWTGRIIGAVILVIFSAGFPILLLVIIGLGVVRGIKMINWARQARSAHPGPEYLAADSRRGVPPRPLSANPRRLATAGAALILLTIALPVAGIVRDFTTNPYAIRGYNAAAESDLRNERLCVEVYFADYNKLPRTQEEMRSLAGCAQTSRGVHLIYEKIESNKYRITTWHEKGTREYRSSSDKSGVYYRDKNTTDTEWTQQ